MFPFSLIFSFHILSEFPWVELEGAQVSVEVEVSEVEAAAAGLLHFLLLSLARNKAL